MPCNLLKINMPFSFVMRGSAVRVRPVAQIGQKVHKNVKMSMLDLI